MKHLETLFEASNYDSKNITNKGNMVVSKASLDKIENDGVTLEFLQGLNVPVFKYKTQITIHGLFPELQRNYIGGYKNLFQNKNLSIGVKWQAVDYAKKDKIYNTVKSFLGGWKLQHTSTDFFIYKTSDLFSDKASYETLLEAAKAEISHIDKSLFFGNCGVYLSQTLWGRYFLVTYINIGAVLERNVIPCIENITGASMAVIEAAEIEKRSKIEADRLQRQAEYAAELERKKAKQIPLKEAAKKILISAGYVQVDMQDIDTSKIYIKIGTDIDTGRYYFVAYKYSKEGRQKKYRYLKAESNDLGLFNFSNREYDKQETVQKKVSGWVKTN